MKKNLIMIMLIVAAWLPGIAQSRVNISLVEEGKSFWDEILTDSSINNKNLLYASYVAYKDRLNDLSIETFRECKASNASHNIISGISDYYIGKNLFLIGKYEDAITQFSVMNNYDLAKYNYLKLAATLNAAIAYYKLGNDEKFRENLQNVISNDISGEYKKEALNLLTLVQQ